MLFRNDEELDVTVVAVASVGAKVEVEGAEGVFGFIDQVKHPSWWDAEVAPPQAGDRLHVCVLDATREPFPRLSALQDDIAIARRRRGDA
ncbi:MULTISPECIES: hypothetical protein [Streptomyces]|uniref:hypothetical protein n=1 Tax=Streptomyces TaxID=1883 RepID=UPI0016796609|nr:MULTISPECIES: hypothetical protein [Streptomyces]MBD3577556.1 hypothetical protein [Streptomyces sp. KD18]GGT09971.1 hypothetical protein GCM10010286_39400 [Streptomyces toxytricini]